MQRAIDSALAQLDGLYNLPLKWPSVEEAFELNTVAAEDDWMLHAHSHCPRFIQLQDTIKDMENTEKMYYELNYDLEMSGFGPELRAKTGTEDSSPIAMYHLCDAIHWMRASNRKLAFNLTDEEWSRVEISKQRKLYPKYDAYEESISLTTYQVMNHFSEFADILNGRLDWRNAPFFTEYFDVDEHTTFPKFILYSTHAEEVAPLLHALDNPLLLDPPPASAVYVEYFESTREGEPALRVRVFFNADTWGFGNRTPLFFDHVEQAEDGSMSAADFQAFIAGKVSAWDEKYVKGDVPEKCDRDFEHVDPGRTDFFAPPEPFREALYARFGITPVMPPASEERDDPRFIQT